MNHETTSIAAAIHETIRQAVSKLGVAHEEITVAYPVNHTHGDYTSNVALRVAKQRNESPLSVAQAIADHLQADLPYGVKRVEIASPGFLNFWLSEEYLAAMLANLTSPEKVALEPRVGCKKRVVIEYSAPNIAKPMGVGHLRSTIIGQALVNVYKAQGFDVIATNHLGDWGTQFGKLIVAYNHWVNPDKFAANPIAHLLELYVRFTQEAKANPALDDEARGVFRELEDGNEVYLKLWQTFRDASLKEFMAIYKQLGVTIAHQMGESDYRSQLPAIYDLVRSKGLVREDNGALVLDLTQEGLGTTLLRKSDEGSLYLTRDLAQIQWRVQHWKPDAIVYVVGQDQSLYFKQLFAVAKKAGIVQGTELVHVGFGLVLLEGKRMRTREGKLVFLKDVLNEAIAKARLIVDEKSRALSESEKQQVAALVGIGSVKYNDLSQNRLSTIAFDWQKMLSLEGNSAPYIMYTIARANSVLIKAGEVAQTATASKLIDTELVIARQLYRYADIIVQAQQKNAPHVIASYLFDLAQGFNEFYAIRPILQAGAEDRATRLQLTKATRTILRHGLGLLGIEAPQRM